MLLLFHSVITNQVLNDGVLISQYFISQNNYTIFFVFNLNHINNAANAVLLNSVKPGDKLGRMKITKHDDNKGRVGGRDPQKMNCQVTMTQTIS